MRLEQDSQTQFKKVGRRSHVYSPSEMALKVLLDTDVKNLQKLLSGTTVFYPEKSPSLTKVCKSLLINHAAYSQAVCKKPSSLSSFNRGGAV